MKKGNSKSYPPPFHPNFSKLKKRTIWRCPFNECTIQSGFFINIDFKSMSSTELVVKCMLETPFNRKVFVVEKTLISNRLNAGLVQILFKDWC